MSARILHLDIETAPNLVYAWGLWGQDIHINQIVEPGYTLCWAAKWHGERKVHFASIHDDDMVERIHGLIDEADICVHYNGNKFDIPHLNMAFLHEGFDPPSETFHIDLLQTVRSRFKEASNKLDWIAKRLDLGGKVQHKGMEMWRDCMDMNAPEHEKSWRDMKKYNIQDVRLLEDVYNRIRGWIKNHPNMGHWASDDSLVCKNCGSSNLKKNGIRYLQSQCYQRYKCLECGAGQRGRQTLKPRSKELTA